MKFIVEIECNNAAFGYYEMEEAFAEVRRILLEQVAEMRGASAVLRDINGNVVGKAFFATDECKTVP